MQTKKQKPNARVLVWDSTLRRIKVHARHAGQFIYRYIDELVPPMPAAVKRKVRK